MRRQVVLAVITGRTVRLEPVDNGAGLTTMRIRALATAAAIEPRCTARSTLIGLRRLPDFEAMAELRGVVVQRIDRTTTTSTRLRRA